VILGRNQAVEVFAGSSRAFSGEVETGSPQKMRPPKENWSEFRMTGTEFALAEKNGERTRPQAYGFTLLDRGVQVY
jgi:hypothetical protein